MKNYTALKNFILAKKHHAFRRELQVDLAKEYSALHLSPVERMARRFELLCQAETPVVFEDENITLLRTIKTLPPIFTDEEWSEIKQKH